jgi:hypothetical protein
MVNLLIGLIGQMEQTFEKQIQQEKEKQHKLQLLLKAYEKFIPKKQLKYLNSTEEERNLTLIQKSFKRKKQTTKFVTLGKKIFRAHKK